MPQSTYSDGLAYLRPQSTGTSTVTSTYPIPTGAALWWFGAYGPNPYSGSGYSYGPPSLTLNGHASNSTQDTYGRNAYYYDPCNYGGDRSDVGPLPPDLLGVVKAKITAPLSLDFLWSGPSPIPDHVTFLLKTHLSTAASASFGTGGATSGVTATASALLPDLMDQSGAIAGYAGSSNSPTFNGFHLLRVVPSGNVATVSVQGEVHADTSDTLPYATWFDSAAPPGASFHGTYYYCGHGNGNTGGSAFSSIIVSAQPDNREVTISSPPIETSYFKGSVGSQHTNGQWPHIRNAAGSMISDSVVVGTATGRWKNGAGTSNSFSANTPGFTNPYYLWSKSGPGTPDSQTAASLGVNQQFLATIPMNLDFGTEPSVTSDPNTVVANNPFPLSITVRADVTDGPNTDGAKAANTYAVTYHLPFENPSKFGPETPDDALEKTTDSLVINTLTIVPIPAKVEAVDLADGAHIAGGVATAVSAGLPLIKVVAQVAEPELVVAQTVFAVFGYTLGLAPDAKPETDPVPVATDYAEFKADVLHQVLINTQPVGQQDMVRFKPEKLAETVAAQLQSNNADWQKDPYFWPDPLRAHLSVSSKIYRYAKKQSVVGDGYGLNGYQGPKYHTVRAEGGFYTVTQWIYTAAP